MFVWIVVPGGRSITEAGQVLIFYLLVFARIHDAMCLNKMFSNLWQKKQAHNIKDTAVYLTVGHGVLFILVCY